jgi:secreted PhoX family phosphatase
MDDRTQHVIGEDANDAAINNDSPNAHFADVLQQRISRRGILAGSLGAAVAATLGSALPFRQARANGLAPTETSLSLGFTAVPPTRSDTATLPDGYQAQVLIPWGEPITGSYPAYKANGRNKGREQEQQVGSHHDGMHYFPFDDDPNGHGLLVVNHEYVDVNVLHANGPTINRGNDPADDERPDDEVRKEIAAHGVSVVEIQRDPATGVWGVVQGSYNRRITADTTMLIRGPVRKSDLVKTKFSPGGGSTRGTINNCANGYTPWGTYLTCEENWAGYFVNKGVRPREQTRYGVATVSSRYEWDKAASRRDRYVRFNCTPTGADATQDYRNEPNGQGWIVEIDPFDPTSVPKKRTALGRFAHEGCWYAPPNEGEPMVFYMGDDAQNEYIYKFVTKARYSSIIARSNNILDAGRLYVARFNADGSGDWLLLDVDDPAFQAAALAAGVTFADQADVLVNTRLAADVVGATKMDRPEWGAVHPETREVYFTLTNNSGRAAGSVDASNPRGPNPYGHIVRWNERRGRPWATSFQWDLFVLSGPEADSQVLPALGGPALNQDNIHASPDGLWFDKFGTLWIQTDMSGSQQSAGPFGANGMLAANPLTGEIKRFLVGPNDQETTGIAATPDGKTLFVNFQHPGDRSAPGSFTSNWPDSGNVFAHPGDPEVIADPSGPRPRSATIVVTREDGGIVGAAME